MVIVVVSVGALRGVPRDDGFQFSNDSASAGEASPRSPGS
jgi:hypothetical protein